MSIAAQLRRQPLQDYPVLAIMVIAPTPVSHPLLRGFAVGTSNLICEAAEV
jgi:hypothetical protein